LKNRRNLQFGMAALLALYCFLGNATRSEAEPRPLPRAAAQKRGSGYSLLPHLNPDKLFLRSEMALVIDVDKGDVLLARKPREQKPIASLTKLMTAMVILDSNLPGDAVIEITRNDRDRLRGSKSHLSYGTKLTRSDLLKITLAGSDNRAAAALGRTFPGGHPAIVMAMNKKAAALGMKDTVFKGVSGLHSGNVSTAADLAILVRAAHQYQTIRNVSTLKQGSVTDLRKGWKVEFFNTNRLVRSNEWDIDLSKTGYIADSGHCLVMWTEIAGRPMIVVLMNSWGKLSKYGDANRIRKWLNRADQNAQKIQKAAAKSSANKSGIPL